MQVFRLSSRETLGAGVLSNGVQLDSVTNISPDLHVAVIAAETLVLANAYTAPQVMANTSGIAPTAGTNTQTGILNRTAGNAWSTLVGTVVSGPIPGLMLTAQYADRVTLVPPTNTAMVQISLTGSLQPGMGFNAGDIADGTHVLQSGQARNGAHVAIAIDQQPAVIYDTGNQTITVSVYLDGLSQHAVTITHTGFYDAALPVINPPVALFTSSLYNKVSATGSTTQGQIAAASTIAALWTITATGSTTYTMTKTLPGGAPSGVGGTFNTGTTYDATGTVPGVALLVNGPLTSTHTATFTTDASMVILDSVSFFTAVGSTAGQYTTPILDATDPATQWFLYEHEDAFFPNGAATVSVSALTGPAIANFTVGSYAPPSGTPMPVTAVDSSEVILNANPDPTTNSGANTYSTIINGTTTALTLLGIVLPSSGAHMIDAGLMPTAVGRYAQFTVNLTVNTQGQMAWARSFSIYAWSPTAAGNPLFIGKMGMPPNWTPGPLQQAFFGSLVTFVADQFADTYEYTDSFGVSTATGQYLLAKGADLNAPHILGEPGSSYQLRLSSSLQAKSLADAPTGIVTSGTGTTAAPLVVPGTGIVTVSPVSGEQGSLYFICQQIAQVVNGTPSTLTATVASSTGFGTVVGGGVTVAQLATRGVSIVLPNPPYPGLPGLAYGTSGGIDNPAKALLKQFCTSLMPAGTLFDPTSSTYLNFGPLG